MWRRSEFRELRRALEGYWRRKAGTGYCSLDGGQASGGDIGWMEADARWS